MRLSEVLEAIGDIDRAKQLTRSRFAMVRELGGDLIGTARENQAFVDMCANTQPVARFSELPLSKMQICARVSEEADTYLRHHQVSNPVGV